MRDIQVNVRMTKAEKSRLGWVSRYLGLSESSVIRMLVKREYERKFQEAAQEALEEQPDAPPRRVRQKGR